MEQNGVVGFRHRRSPSSDRFLDVFSPPPSETSLGGSNTAAGSGDELNEDDVFWTGEDFSESHGKSKSPSKNHLRQSFRQPEKFGILAALQEDHRKLDRSVLYRKPSIISSSPPVAKLPVSLTTGTTSSSRAIPKPPAERDSSSNFSQSMPARKFQHSAPLNIPMMPRKPPRKTDLADVDMENDAEDEMLPPHEIVARGSAKSPKTTFSVLEGVGRTLKGRDLRLVRNAVWRQTGFLD